LIADIRENPTTRICLSFILQSDSLSRNRV
jgi:hypothetical protein